MHETSREGEDGQRLEVEIAVTAAARLIRLGRYSMANRILAELAYENPECPDVWASLSRLRTRQRKAEEATLFEHLAASLRRVEAPGRRRAC